LALKGKQQLEEVLSLTILVLIALALCIAPLYMLYERLMGGESFIKLVSDSHLIRVTRESLEKGVCLTLVA
jgi:ABC-type Fe3+ transport system permease subunit